MNNADDLNLTVLRFFEAAAEMGRYHAADDADRDEFEDAMGRLEAAYDGLVKCGSEPLLVSLLDSEDAFVQLYAAQMLLRTDERLATETLERLRRATSPRNVAANAYRILTHWKKGWLFSRKR